MADGQRTTQFNKTVWGPCACIILLVIVWVGSSGSCGSQKLSETPENSQKFQQLSEDLVCQIGPYCGRVNDW